MTHTNEELRLWLDGRVIEDSEVASEKLYHFLIEVFKRLPDDDVDVLLDDRDVRFICPQTNTIKPLHHFRAQEIWLVMFTTDLLDKPKDEIIYTIAHELAHVYAKDVIVWPDSSVKDLCKSIEIDADKQVVKWGFEKELKATSNNYLYGDGVLM